MNPPLCGEDSLLKLLLRSELLLIYYSELRASINYWLALDLGDR